MRKVLQVLLTLIFLIPFCVSAQIKVINGEVLDKQSDEPIPFASVKFTIQLGGMLTDSLGRFSIVLNTKTAVDTISITSVGYVPEKIAVSDIADSSFITIQLTVAQSQKEVVIKTKYNRALLFWRKIIQHKPENDRRQYDNYGYEVYNKLELDLDNINKEKLGKNFLLKPLSFVLDYVDSTSENKPFSLPVYLTENAF